MHLPHLPPGDSTGVQFRERKMITGLRHIDAVFFLRQTQRDDQLAYSVPPNRGLRDGAFTRLL